MLNVVCHFHAANNCGMKPNRVAFRLFQDETISSLQFDNLIDAIPIQAIIIAHGDGRKWYLVYRVDGTLNYCCHRRVSKSTMNQIGHVIRSHCCKRYNHCPNDANTEYRKPF